MTMSRLETGIISGDVVTWALLVTVAATFVLLFKFLRGKSFLLFFLSVFLLCCFLIQHRFNFLLLLTFCTPVMCSIFILELSFMSCSTMDSLVNHCLSITFCLLIMIVSINFSCRNNSTLASYLKTLSVLRIYGFR